MLNISIIIIINIILHLVNKKKTGKKIKKYVKVHR